MRVTENNTDLRGSSTLSGESADLLLDLGGSGLEPGGGNARVGERGIRNSLSVRVKTTHFGSCFCRLVVIVEVAKMVGKVGKLLSSRSFE